jgi:hypothetical protein
LMHVYNINRNDFEQKLSIHWIDWPMELM